MINKLPISFDTRYFPAILSLALLGLLLLFTKELPDNIKNYLIPLLAVHVIFSGFLAYLQTMWLVRRGGDMLADWQWRTIFGSHFALALGVAGYCFYRGIL